MAPITTSLTNCIRMGFNLHRTCKLQTIVLCLAEKGCAQACAKIRARIAFASMTGTGATCMVLGYTLLTWHRKAIGMFRSPGRAAAGIDIA